MNAPFSLVDTHAHLVDTRISARIEEVLAAARLAGVHRIISIATTATDSQEGIRLAEAHPEIQATVGIHPNDAIDATESDWSQIMEMTSSPAVVGIGETGLDRHWDRTPFALQQDYFARHLELADRLGLPVVIHSRECHRDVVEQLETLNRPIRGVAHSFTGTWDDAQELLALGLSISFAGMLTFANKSLDPLRRAAQEVPIERLLVETDSPYLSPVPFRGQCNEPCRVVHTASRLAEIRGISLDELARITTQNSTELFRRLVD